MLTIQLTLFFRSFAPNQTIRSLDLDQLRDRLAVRARPAQPVLAAEPAEGDLPHFAITIT